MLIAQGIADETTHDNGAGNKSPVVTIEGNETSHDTVKETLKQAPSVSNDTTANKATKFFTTEGSPIHSTGLLTPVDSVSHPLTNPREIVIDKVHQLGKEVMTYELQDNLPEDQIHILKVTGVGELLIEIFSPGNTAYPDYSHTITLDNLLKPSLIPIGWIYATYKGTMIRVSSPPNPILVSSLNFVLQQQKAISIAFNENFKIYTSFVSRLHLMVTIPNVNANMTLSNRLQFIVQTSLETQTLYGGEMAEMYINKSPYFPNETNYEMMASGNLGSGLIKTLAPNSEHYCFKEDCVYYVTIFTNGIAYINFFPSVFANGSLLKFHHYLFLIEEIEPHEKIEYELEVPKIDGNWVFSVIPTMGSVELFINPDEKPKNLDNYKYMIASHRPEEIVITAHEANKFGFSHQKFFVTYKSYTDEIPAAFRFEVKRYNPTDRKYIKENYAEAGVVANEEMINYFLDLGSDIPQTLSAVFKLDSYQGNADLYIKECLPGETECWIKTEDLDSFSGSNSEKNKKRIMRVSKAQVVDQKSNPVKKDLVTLNFNCLKDGQHKIENHYPISKSCLFVIGVHCRDSTNKFGAYYKLVAHGQGVITNLKLRTQTIVKLGPGERLSYRINLGKSLASRDITSLYVKTVAINGLARVYFSKTNEVPDAMDNEQSIYIQDDHLVSLRTAVYDVFISLDGPFKPEEDTNDKYVFMTIESSEYSVLDFYAELIGPHAPSGTEIIGESNILHRQITSTQAFTDPVTESKIYFTNFHFKVPEKGQYSYYTIPKLNISVNSQLVGLRICIQENRTEFDPHMPCSFKSNTDHMTLDSSMTNFDKGKNFIISVQKIVKKEESFAKFPVDFTLSLNSGSNVKAQDLYVSGKTFTSILHENEGMQFSIDLRSMTKRAQIYFYASDPNAQANVSIGEGSEYVHLASLDQGYIGLNIINAATFKSQFCKKDCTLRVNVYTFGGQSSPFSVMYVIDDMPIILKEGDQLIVANNVDTYFAYEAEDTTHASFSTYADRALSVIYSKILPERSFYGSKEISTELSEINFDFKTNIENAPRIVYPKDVLEKSSNKLLGFYVQPKMHYRAPVSELFDLVAQADSLTVYMHTKSQKLLPFILTDGNVKNGEFVYYHFTIDHPQDFSVILTLHGGEASMFMSRGEEDFPTEKRHWKKSSGTKGDEIIITQDMFDDPKQIVSTYVIGVKGNTQSHFSVLFMPEFKNLVKMRFQRLIDMELTKDKNYYFDFFNTHESYNTLLYAEDSDIEVSALNYDESKYQDFISMVTNEDNYVQKFTFKKGDLPRKKFYEHSVAVGTHIIVRIKAIDSNARVNFAIYDSSQPILAPAEKRFTFVQNKDDTSIFKVRLGSTYEEVDFDIKLEFGSVNVGYGESQDKYDNQQKITIPSQKYFQYKVEKIERSNDFLIFNEFYIQVKAFEFSKFSILVKPRDKFKRLKAFEPEIVYTDPDKDIYLYYHISPNHVQSIHNLQIDFDSVHYYEQRPELLFLAETDIVLSESSPYLPMPLTDLISRDSGEFRHLVIKPDIQPGFFVLKIEKFPSKLPIKVNVSLNNHKNIEINGLYHGAIPQSKHASHQYSMFIPRAGEFRLVLESCSGVKIDSAEFHATHAIAAEAANEDHNQYTYNKQIHATAIKFEDRFVQGYSFLFLNETHNGEQRDFRMLSYPVKRGFVNEHGVLRFKIVDDENKSALNSVYHEDEHYALLTEFRPNSKELILKDYIKIFDETDQANKKLFSYNYKQNNNKLMIKARMPSFKPQLLVDYPELKSVKVKLFVYLLAEPEVISKLEHCGHSMLSTVKHHSKIIEKNLTRDELSAINESKFEEIEFDSEALSDYRSNAHVNVLGYVSVRFFENADDEFNVNLDFKYTSVPYFLMTIPNKSGALISVTAGLAIGAVIIAIFFIVFYSKARKTMPEPSSNKYSKANNDSINAGSTRLEMSSISRNDWD